MISKWDCLPCPKNDTLTKYVDVVGCIIPNSPSAERVCSGPNYRKLLLLPTQHVKSCHPHTSEEHLSSSTTTKRQSGIAKIAMNASDGSPPVKKVVIDKNPKQVTSKDPKQSTLTIKLLINTFLLGKNISF